MKLKILRNDLYNGLKRIQGLVEKRHTLPILSNFLLRAREEWVEILATDLEIGFKGSLPAEVLESGEIALSARKSFDMVREFPPHATIAIATEPGNWVKIEAERSVFRIAGRQSEDYPALDEYPSGCSFSAEARLLREMIAKTIFAAAQEDGKQALNGILLSIQKDGIQMIATDGHRLAIIRKGLEVADAEEAFQVIIPKKALLELRKVLEEDECQVRVTAHENGLMFRKEGVQLTARALEGPFPEYDYVIPKSSDKVLKIGREELLQAIRRVSLLSDELFKPIVMKIGEEVVEVRSNSPELGEAWEVIPAQLQGEELEIGFNARYLLDVLSAMEEELVVMEMNNSVEATLIRPLEGRDYLYVVMPMRFN